MAPTVMARSGLRTMLSDLLAGTLTPAMLSAKAQPFTNNVNPGPGAVIGDFTLATFVDGATPKTITWGEQFDAPDGYPQSLSGVLQWNWNSGVSETVYGLVLTTSAGALLGYARLDTPKLMATTNDSLPVVAAFKLSPDGFGTWSFLGA